MPTTTEEKFGGIGSSAVKAKTGKDWKQWFAILDKAGAKKWKHSEIAAYLHDECDCPPWWSQMVTVGYEQARGLRVKHQMADGFSMSVSKTITAPLAKLFAAWKDAKARSPWFRDAAKIEIRKSTANKRLLLTGATGSTAIDINFYDKGPGKSQLVVQERKLKDAKHVEKTKKYWDGALEKLKAHLETSATTGTSKPSGRAKGTTGPDKKRRTAASTRE